MLGKLSEKLYNTVTQKGGAANVRALATPSYPQTPKPVGIIVNSVLDAPELGAIELITLKTLAEVSANARVLLENLQRYRPFKKYTPQRFHSVLQKMLKRGWIEKHATNARVISYQITDSGRDARTNALKFFTSL